MMKKVLLGLLGTAVLTTGLIGFTKARGYVRLMRQQTTEAIEEAIPPELELDRLRNEVKGLDRDLEQSKSRLARARFELNEGRKDIDETKVRTDKEEKALRAKGETYKAASTKDRLEWYGRQVSYDEGKELLAREVGRLKGRKKDLETKQKIVEMKEQSVAVLEKQVTALKTQQDELLVQLEVLKHDLELAKLEQAESRRQTDGTHLADTKEAIRKLRERVEIQRESRKIDQEMDKPKGEAETRSFDEIMKDL